MKKWMNLVKDLLPLIDVEREKRTIHHWPFSRWFHCVLVSWIGTILAPKKFQREIARAALLHDLDNVVTTDVINSWSTLLLYGKYIRRVINPEEPKRIAMSLGLSRPATEAIRNHMKKMSPIMWLDNPLTALLMAADALGHMSEYFLFPWVYQRIQKIGRI